LDLTAIGMPFRLASEWRCISRMRIESRTGVHDGRCGRPKLIRSALFTVTAAPWQRTTHRDDTYARALAQWAQRACAPSSGSRGRCPPRKALVFFAAAQTTGDWFSWGCCYDTVVAGGQLIMLAESTEIAMEVMQVCRVGPLD
jgi:hypothetical protein